MEKRKTLQNPFVHATSVSLLVLCIHLMQTPIHSVYSEEFYYLEDHMLVRPPVFCAIDFEDPKLPDAHSLVMQITKEAIEDWETRLMKYTGNKEGWDFTFKTIPFDEKDNFATYDCDIMIYYEREPLTKEEKGLTGHTSGHGSFADITIFYLSHVYGPTGEVVEINGETFQRIAIQSYNNSIDPLLSGTIKHEIGHALGLDHSKFNQKDFKKNSEGFILSPSIMIDTYDIILEDKPHFEITDYDIRAVVAKYGKEGIAEPAYYDYIDYAIVTVVISVVIFLIIKRKYKMKLKN